MNNITMLRPRKPPIQSQNTLFIILGCARHVRAGQNQPPAVPSEIVTHAPERAFEIVYKPGLFTEIGRIGCVRLKTL